MTENIKENVTRRGIWLRLVFMIALGVAFSVAQGIVCVVVVFQFLASLISGQSNVHLIGFGRGLARYLQQITEYLVFATEEKPFPFAPWQNDSNDEMQGREGGGEPDLFKPSSQAGQDG